MKRAALLALLLLSACADRGGLRIISAPPAPRPTLVPTPGTQAAASIRVVRLQAGDSFWSVARRTLGRGSAYLILATYNDLSPTALLLPGRRLKLPPGDYRYLEAHRSSKAEEWPKRENRAYAVGEKLTFAVQYLDVTAGHAILSIPEYSEQQGRICLHVIATAESASFFDPFFKVRDHIETFIDADALIPWRYEKHIREGAFSADAFYIFDQRRHLMLEPSRGTSVTVPAETQDVLSCFFWFRNMDLTPGHKNVIEVSADDMKSYELSVDVLRKEHVSTLAGDFDCIVVQPHLTFAGFIQSKGEVLLWISNDVRRIPVLMQLKIPVGTFQLNLQDAAWAQAQ